MIMAIEKLLLTIAEVCEATGLGQTTVKSLISRGDLNSITVGRARRIPADALEQWITRERESQSIGT